MATFWSSAIRNARRRALLLLLPAIAIAQPRFEVASVKLLPEDQGVFGTRPQRLPGRFRWTTQLAYLVGYAYHTEWWRISGDTPGWGSIYQVEATHDPKASEDQVRLMLQALLADRFQMKIHRVTKEVDGYALSLSKDGSKMQEAKEGEIPPLPEWMRGPNDNAANLEERVIATMPTQGVGILAGRRVTVLNVTETLQRLLNAPVLDETGLSGRYYFAFRYALDSDPDIPYPPLAATFKDLGLRLEKRKGPAEMIVIDHLEKIPAEN